MLFSHCNGCKNEHARCVCNVNDGPRTRASRRRGDGKTPEVGPPGPAAGRGRGDHFDRPTADQPPLTIIRPRQHPTIKILGLRLGVPDSTVSRVRNRCVPPAVAPNRSVVSIRGRTFQGASAV
ncbi:hypothetical protein GobsT_10950 [Gemmata obscuriglobus]|uniref:Uncharacterized protein n=1 Tax=Gemmata obscuriglobus TaxID=114 RepID=A0A2Z3HA43_9BACT|nr:hypothetical protein [Gemmata obscuriglobus]AWM40407.1 hypothetical protein C1280_27765 [Gemmata obscuriglobus]QEG26356.1 hypothetical protein GobsT_10950 [Gemmata obscuriglobus]VTS01358.1 unnamed protein product [Gemmata obscuriglobus UQM 2246]